MYNEENDGDDKVYSCVHKFTHPDRISKFLGVISVLIVFLKRVNTVVC